MLSSRWLCSLIALALGGFVFGFVGCSGRKSYGSPAGYRQVVLREGTWGPDTVWTVTIREHRVLGARRDIGCFTDDDPDGATPTGVSWRSEDEFFISTTAGEEDVRVVLGPDGVVRDVQQAHRALLTPCPAS